MLNFSNAILVFIKKMCICIPHSCQLINHFHGHNELKQNEPI